MTIAVEAMKALLQKDFKNIGFSAYNSGQSSPADYIAEQAFTLAEAMMERSKIVGVKQDDDQD